MLFALMSSSQRSLDNETQDIHVLSFKRSFLASREDKKYRRKVRPSQTRHTDMQFFRSKTQDDIFNPIFSPKLSAMRWL